MQSPTQENSGSNPVTTAPTDQPLDTGTEAQPAHFEPNAQEEKTKSASPVETETLITPQETQTGVQMAETPATVAFTQAVEKETTVQPVSELSENSERMEVDSASKQSAPTDSDTNTDRQCDGQITKKQEKGQRDGKKYVPSKKAMIDPLKMDMSKPLHLTSSQLSLQCIQCHIIFRDPKSKVRHMKLSHPGQYEQSILRNALFACYVCDSYFTNSTELMIHQKAHIEKKPFKCPLCGVAFNKSSELTLHKKTHFGQDGYACTDCGKSCKTLTLLKYHSRTHTGERPYVCIECGKRFTMSKALQKHILSHLPGGPEDEGETTAKPQKNKTDGTYSCPICKGTFKTTKTRLRHMKNKHKVTTAACNALLAGQQVKQNMPIITPISISQPALLQVEPNGPLQKVDANIDTDQIRKLIESLGNVQKVNQVVILGQVPPHAQPLEVQQISHLAEPVNLNLSPPQIDFIGLKQSESKTVELDTTNQCNSLEQTIILEPITPDGQLENPSISEPGSHIAAGENIELTLVQTEQTEQPEGQVMHQILQQPNISAIQSDPVDEMVCQNEVADLKQNLEQTVILELTPALIPTLELEQPQTVPQNETPSSSLFPTTELEKSPDHTPHQTVIDEQETSLSVPPLMPTVELELTPLQTEQQDLTSCPFVPPDTLTQAPSESETNSKEEVDSQIQTVSLDQVHHVMDEAAPQEMEEKAEREPSEKLLVDSKEGQEQLENLFEVGDTSAKEVVSTQLETKQVPQISELPVNVMSAQELVKVRKRKTARAFIFQGHQGYMQELVGSIHKDDLQIDARPAKRQRRKKSHLVVKFGPQSKEKKNKKQKTPPQQHQPTQEEEITTNLLDIKATSQKKGRKGKKGRKVGNFVSTEIKSPSSTQDPQVQQIKENTRKNKIKRQIKEARRGVTHISEHKTGASPVFKKKKQGKIMRKDQPKNAKDGKRKKNLSKEEKVNTKTSTASADIPGPHIMQDSLLLLKGHKQPQLKVYKLDPSKTSGQAQDTSPTETQTMSQPSEDNNHPTNDLKAESKKKGGRPKKNQKALSLLSSLQVSCQTPEALPPKPKTTRKRKASSKVETEGIITSSQSKRALECNDCGERFSEVSSLQKHKGKVHIIESPGLTYTNGNIFEGVSRLDLYQLPKHHDKVVGVVNAAADWDTEPEMGEAALEDRERTLSFPALIPSPSLPVPPPDVEVSAYEDKGGSKTGADQSRTASEVHSPSDQLKNSEISQNFTSESALSTSTQAKSLKTGEPLASDETEQEKDTPKHLSLESEVQATTEEDIKEDLLLEVDLVTVGEQNERDAPSSPQESVPQSESKGTHNSEGGSVETFIAPEKTDETTMEKSLTLQTVSCSTHQVEIKEEEEEMLVQRKKEGGKETVTRNATRGRKRGTGCLKRDAISKILLGAGTVRGTEPEEEQDECQVVYESNPVTSVSEIHDKGETGTKTSQSVTSHEFEANKTTAPAVCLPSVTSTLEESPEEQVVFELESVTAGVEEVINKGGLQGGGEYGRETDQSPGIILEKVLTSSQRETADKEPCLMTPSSSQRQGLDSITENEVQLPGSQEIKVEENNSDPLLAAPTCQNRKSASVQPQHHHDIRTVLVKEESSLMLNEAQASQGSRHIRWNVEPVSNENTATPLMESGETTSDCRITPEFNTNQCIFYPVKEEEREVLLGDTQTCRGSLMPEGYGVAHQTEPQTADTLHEGSHSTQDYQEVGVRGLLSESRVNDFADGQVEADAEWPHPSDLRDFLLRGSNEDYVGGFELSDPQLDSEAEVMDYFSKNQTNGARQPDQTLQNLPTSTSQLQAPRDANGTRKPIDYFSKYFGWDTWVEIASCTNKLSSMPNPITAREVAQFVGIHIAMGTLKFPSPRLYWEDLTKVPLIAEAMPLSRFLELSCMLKLASPAQDPVTINVQEGQHDGDFGKGQLGKDLPSRQCVISQHSDGQCQGDKPNDLNSSKTQTDPLWKVRPLLCRFKAGCQSLKREGDYAVDQYPLPLTGKMHNNKLSLHCTTLIGLGGLLLHVDLKLDLSDKEDAVEKMAPRGSMVFLCKQDLSTPAMLERLLVAGVHGAGRVGGARGQIGDEFVSSDGKLMLRRSHCGFILSTAGNGQRNMTSLTDNFEKAQMSARLSRDLRNLYPIPLTASAPTCWPQAVLWYLTDLALVNSWLLYRQDHGAVSAPFTLMAFRLEVSKALILSSGSDTQDSVPPQPPTEKARTTNETPNPSLVEENSLPNAATRYDGSGHWPEQLAEGEGGRCRFKDCQRTSRVLCLKCCVFLCISRNHNCFLNFHNRGSLGKE
ncbi:zinc finger protein 576, tandem duplicate 1 isoform X2 [Trachinotus anak]|uniref:zinc finger protein 576, tandem duplicate 1 isoform X2 n=1 Tax=Trachinotus anak TaxID=443729 RepID=UPI0039F2164F